MTKFGKYLHTHSIPEWSTQYIRYKKLKKVLKQISRELAQSNNTPTKQSMNQVDTARALAQRSHDWARQALEQVQNPSVKPITIPQSSTVETPSGVRIRRLPLGVITADRGRAPLEPLPTPASISSNQSNHIHGSSNSGLTIAELTDKSGYDSLNRNSLLSNAMSDILVGSNQQQFFTILDADLLTINNFYLLQEEFFLKKTEVLTDQINALLSSSQDRQTLPTHAARTLSRAIKELYRGIQILRNYRILNYTGFVKVLKKYDKATGSKSSSRCLPIVQRSHFVQSTIIDELQTQIETLYSSAFQQGDRRKAVTKLKVDESQQVSTWLIFRFGAMVGLMIALLAVLGFLIPEVEKITFVEEVGNLVSALPVFRCLGLLFLALWGWGCTIYLLELVRINWAFILEVDTRSEMKFIEVFHLASIFSLMWLSAVVLYLYCAIGRVNDNWGSVACEFVPFTLFIVTLIAFMMPVRIFYHKTRFFLMRSLGRLVIAPFSSAPFLDTFMGDQLCSLVNIFNDIFYSLCWFTSGDFVNFRSDNCVYISSQSVWALAFLPYYWRFMQCMRRYNDTKNPRFLFNGGKYVCSLVIVLFNLLQQNFPHILAFRVLWIICAAAGTSYTYVWDIRYDWQLLSPSCRDPKKPNFLLRPQLAIPSKSVYYFAMFSNLLLRLVWLFTISPAVFWAAIPPDYFKTVVFSLEIVRRCQWNILRLECEHQTNCEQNRAVNVVPLPLGLAGRHEDVHIHTAPEAAILIDKAVDQHAMSKKHIESDEEKSNNSPPPPRMSVMKRQTSTSRSVIRPYVGSDDSPDDSPDSQPDADDTTDYANRVQSIRPQHLTPVISAVSLIELAGKSNSPARRAPPGHQPTSSLAINEIRNHFDAVKAHHDRMGSQMVPRMDAASDPASRPGTPLHRVTIVEPDASYPIQRRRSGSNSLSSMQSSFASTFGGTDATLEVPAWLAGEINTDKTT